MRTAMWRVALAMCMAAIFALSLMPPSPEMPTTGWDKTNHVLGFATLGLLSHGSWPGRRMAALAGLLAYGGLIEILQSLTPTRSAEFGDLIADAIGLAAGAVLALLLARWMPTRQAPR